MESSTTTTRFPRDGFLDEVEFHPHVEIADQLCRLQKRASDVVVAHEGVLVGNPKLLRKTERRVVAGIRHRHDDVGLDGMQPGKLPSHPAAHTVDADVVDEAVRTRKIDILEHAERPLFLVERELRADAVLVDDDDFARLDLADKLGVNEIECARFARQNVSAVELAERERTESERIADADDLPLAHHHERERALDFAERREHAARAAWLREQVENDLAIDGRLENGAVLFEFVAQEGGVDQVAIVADGKLAARAIHHERLRVFDVARAGRRIPHVADGAVALESLQIGGRKHLRHQPHVLARDELTVRTVRGDDARALLSAMLQGEKAVIGQHRNIWMSEHGENAALVFGFVGIVHSQFSVIASRMEKYHAL